MTEILAAFNTWAEAANAAQAAMLCVEQATTPAEKDAARTLLWKATEAWDEANKALYERTARGCETTRQVIRRERMMASFVAPAEPVAGEN